MGVDSYSVRLKRTTDGMKIKTHDNWEVFKPGMGRKFANAGCISLSRDGERVSDEHDTVLIKTSDMTEGETYVIRADGTVEREPSILSVKLQGESFLALVSWNCRPWIVIWTQKGGKIFMEQKCPLYEFLRELDEEDRAKLNGLPMNTTYDENYKVAFGLY